MSGTRCDSCSLSALAYNQAASGHDVAIVGAGPVGLLLGCLLGSRGFRVLIMDRRVAPLAHSQAIGITPPSLQILAQLGLDQEFIRRGVPISDCHVHGQSGYLGCASFRDIPSHYRFILSLPQQINVSVLEARLAAFPNVALRRGVEITGLVQVDGRVRLQGESPEGPVEVTAAWAIGCDGHRSRVRDLLKVRTRGGDYGCHFVMADFADHTALGDRAHLFFTALGAVESFPLPNKKRRWIVQTAAPMPDAPACFISAAVKERAGIQLPPDHQLNRSHFSPRWLDCAPYHHGRVILCGDAAHLMSPIGGQGMNTGWADAEFVAGMIEAIERRGASAAPLLAAYDHCRRRAARAATRRAALGMWLGTRTGLLASTVRDGLIRHLLLKGPAAARIGPHFAMLTIPCNSLALAPARVRQALAHDPAAKAPLPPVPILPQDLA